MASAGYHPYMPRFDNKRSRRTIWQQRLADARVLLWFLLLAGLFALRSALSRRRWELARARPRRREMATGASAQGTSGSRGRDMRAMRSATPG